MGLTFEDNSEQVKKYLEAACLDGLIEAGSEMLHQVQQNTKVKTGRTKASWKLNVNESELKAVIGSDFENAIWEEFGTGEYALHGDGRKGGWFYEDAQGVGHFTKGKHPRRPMHNAFTSKKNTCVKIIQSKLKGLG